MSEGEEKLHPPTQRKREEARRKGQFARSSDLSAAAVLLTAILLMQITGPKLIAAWKALIIGAFAGGATTWNSLVSAVAPLLVGVIVVAIVINCIQVGFIFRPKLELDAINPGKGFERVFSRRSFGQFAMNLLKLIVVASVTWMTIGNCVDRIVSLQQQSPVDALVAGADVIFAVGVRIAIALLILGGIDYAIRWWTREQDLRMTRREMRDEMREMEIHQGVKQRRREILSAMGRAS